MILVQSLTHAVSFPRCILESTSSIVDKDLELKSIRLPFAAKPVNILLQLLHLVYRNPVPAVPIEQLVRPRMTNGGVWQYSFDLERHVGQKIFALLNNDQTVTELVKVNHFVNCECLRWVISAAYVYHRISEKQHYVYM
jgi:hypothetical protein